MQKLISYRSSELLTGLSKAGKDFFNLREAESILSQKKKSSVAKLLHDMVKRGLIMRIKDGVYHRIPYEQNAETYFPNWHLTAEALAQPKEHYIGFYSALAIHGLITQPSMVEQIVTQEQMHPHSKQIKNVRFEFITLGKNRFFGYSKTWTDDFHKVNCSDPEKTFIDCLYMPGHGGGITETAKALYKYREKINTERMKEYLEKFNTQAVYKRLGFILEQLGILPELRNFIVGKISASYTPLDPSLPPNGNHYSKWKVIDNVDFRTVRHSIYT